jgi:hypothetical protein
MARRWRNAIQIVSGINIVWALPMALFREPKRVEFLKSQIASSRIITPARTQNNLEEELKNTQVSMNPATPPEEQFNNYSPIKPYKVLTFSQKLKVRKRVS